MKNEFKFQNLYIIINLNYLNNFFVIYIAFLNYSIIIVKMGYILKLKLDFSGGNFKKITFKKNVFQTAKIIDTTFYLGRNFKYERNLFSH